ncbi:MAG: DUF386 domain-containing protein [Cyanobacteria bacterium SIG28]|nr:DUF386 domain-containing protein [Cyanobacteria bacterium SIG28]
MIKDSLKNAGIYFSLSENLKKGLEWLKAQDLVNIACGRYEIDSDAVWANVQEYETKDDANFEAHRKYIDIQYMIKGEELVGVIDLVNCKTCIEYDNEKDLEFFETKAKFQYQELREGDFLIFYPHDAHKPSIAFGAKSMVKKVVVKVAVD